MATTFVDYTGDGNATKAFSFPSIKEADVKVKVDDVLKTVSTHYNITSYTTTGGGNVVFTSGNIPANPAAIRIYRDTDVDTAKATYTAGSSVKAGDLNNNNKQLLFAAQEEQNIVNATTTVSGFMSKADKTKLDGVETAATADQTAAEIRTLVESATDSNVFTDADHTKLNAIEAGATGDQTNAEIRAAVEAASDSNVFTDADHTKLNAIESGATADQTNTEIKTAYEANSNTNAFTDAEKTKLSGIEASATADQTNAEIKTAYEANSNTNAFTDAEKTKLSGVEASADVTDATNVNAAGAVMNSDLDGKGEILIGDGSGDPTALAVGTNNYVLTADSGEATGVKWAAAQGGGGGGGVSNIVEDTSPQLGGNLDVQAREINTSTTNGNIKVTPNGTGLFEVKGNTNAGTLQLNCESNSHGIKLKSPPHSAAASYTLTFPNNVVNGQFLKTDASGNLSWAAVDLTALSASNLTSGTIPDARFPATLPAVSGANLTNLPASAFNILINTLSSSSGTGGGSATFNGTATRFTLSNAGPNAQAHIVSVNGVIQKPNSGTSPSEGYAIDGNDIIFASAPANGADFFIVTIGKAVTIGAPSDNTVTTAKITDLNVTTGKIANTAVTTGKIATDAVTNDKIAVNAIDHTQIIDDAVRTQHIAAMQITEAKMASDAISESVLKVSNSPTNGYFLSAQSGNTGGLTWAEVSAGVTSDGQSNTVAGTGAGANFSGTDATNNTLYGKDAGNDITTGDNNTAIGVNALALNTTGYESTVIGGNASKTTTTGRQNVAIGYNCFQANTVGKENVIIGQNAGYSNTDADENTFVGQSAGYSNTTGEKNTFIGRKAGQLNTTASLNTACGHKALEANTTGTNNTAVGAAALDANTTASENTAVGYNSMGATTTGGNNAALGFGALRTNTTGTDNVAVGKVALAASTTAGNNVAVGSSALASNTTGTQNIGIGNVAGGAITTGGSNVAVGSQALQSLTTGSRNIAIGRQAMSSVAVNAYDNMGIGEGACQNINNNVYYNIGIGNYALDACTTGTHNTCMGYAAGTNSTTGTGNTYLGQTAAGSATTGSSNVVIGASAGYDITTGSNLVCIGHAAGYSAGNDIVDGQYGIYLGAFSMAGATNANYEIVLGYNTQGKGTQTGYISPGGGGVYQGNNSSSWSTTSDERIKKNIVNNNSGLDLLKQIQVKNFEYKTKKEIENDSPELKDVSGSAVVEKEGTQLGVIAQEIEKFLPEVVKTEASGVKSVNTDHLTWYLINAVKDLSTKVQALEAK